ncbi:MAG: hypothetical protein KY461_11045 [Actinobacteria bacterium]|nr:hypothetical protein [Actinomycetota bacterium]
MRAIRRSTVPTALLTATLLFGAAACEAEGGGEAELEDVGGGGEGELEVEE